MKNDELLLIGGGVALLYFLGRNSGGNMAPGRIEYVGGDGLNLPEDTIGIPGRTWFDAVKILASFFATGVPPSGGVTRETGFNLAEALNNIFGSGQKGTGSPFPPTGGTFPGTPPINP